jgi:8-oxo-dGTP pyrophosphatase MutT (NUDIX family)
MSKGKSTYMKKQADLFWKKGNTSLLCKTRIANITEVEYTSPTGKTSPFIVVDAPDWVITVPFIKKDDGDYFIMVKQWRHGANEVSIEFPGGVINQGENPQDGARRELLEETGFEAKTLVHLGSLYSNPAIMSNKVHIFAALDLHNTKIRHLDDDEYVDFLLEPVKKIYDSMGKEPYIHALMCAALDLFKRNSTNLITF